MTRRRREGEKEREARAADVIDEHNPVIVAGYGRFGQVVGRLLNARGIGTTVIDHDPNQIELVRRFGQKAYYGDVTRLDLLEALRVRVDATRVGAEGSGGLLRQRGRGVQVLGDGRECRIDLGQLTNRPGGAAQALDRGAVVVSGEIATLTDDVVKKHLQV